MAEDSSTSSKPNLADLRTDYAKNALDESSVDRDAIAQFTKWFNEAIKAEIPDPNAMTLATVNAAGVPSARIVLLKGVDSSGFTFFTNYNSRKGSDLAANPNVALTFFWPPLERQVNIRGTVAKVSREMSEIYFHSRPRLSQISAWASHQSESVANRAELENRIKEYTQSFDNHQVPLPDYWGGYCVTPSELEFWQGRRSRLHDRIVYRRQHDGSWFIGRLQP